MIYRFFALLNAPIIGADPMGTGGAGAEPGVSGAQAAGDIVSTATETVGGGGLFDGGMGGMIAVYAVILIGMYFLLMRPQRKREKQQKEMQAAIRVGDNVVTSSGMFGKVTDVGDDCFIIEFGTNRGIRIPVRKSDVLGVKEPKLTPPPKTD